MTSIAQGSGHPARTRIRTVAPSVAALLGALALSALVFDPFGLDVPRVPLSFLALFALIVIALRFPVNVALLAVLETGVLAAVGTARGNGPFGDDSLEARSGVLGGFLGSAAGIVWVIAVLKAKHRSAETALAATAAEYRAVVDDAPALICRYLPNGILTFANEPLCQFLGRPRNHVLGGSVLELLPLLPVPNDPTELPSPVSPEGLLSRIGPLIRVDGTERWHRWTARPIGDVDGRVREFHAVGVDITERRRKDEEHRLLERKVLETQRLESLGVLAGGIAHDFNNLLARILGHAELILAEAPSDTPARGHVEDVLIGVKQASDLTRQLLAYSGKGKFLIRQVDMSGLVRQTETLLRTTVPRRCEFAFHLSDSLPAVAADPTQMRQVLVNLVINAGEASGDRSGAIHVTCRSGDLTRDQLPDSYLFHPLAPGRYVTLEVADNGCGMDDATRERLFDPFFTTKFAGRGLGMAAVLGIVRSHRGGIRVHSQPGAGTHIVIYLPAATPSPRVQSPPVATAGRVASDGRSRPLILLVDDEDAVRRVAQLMLQQLGYDVIAVAEGLEAVSLFERNRGQIQAVLLDLTMPRMDGSEVLAAIRRTNPTTPVVLCSGYSADAVSDTLGSAENTTFLQKPFTMADLGRTIRDAIAGPNAT